MHTPLTTVIHALVPCAGMGLRAGVGVPKQYAPVLGKAMVVHTLEALLRVPSIARVMVVVSAEDQHFDAVVPLALRSRVQREAAGGSTRAATVTNGLQRLLAGGASRNDWVLVHDAARCLVDPANVQQLVDACREDTVGGLLALPLTDTLKQADGARVATTLDRSDKWLAQTPQMFRLGVLLDALHACTQDGVDVTDEASAIEHAGLQPLLVRGDPMNIKITWPEQFALAERWMRTP